MTIVNGTTNSFPNVYVTKEGEVVTLALQTLSVIVTDAVTSISFTFQAPKGFCIDPDAPLAVVGNGIDFTTFHNLILSSATVTNNTLITVTFVSTSTATIPAGTYALHGTITGRTLQSCD